MRLSVHCLATSLARRVTSSEALAMSLAHWMSALLFPLAPRTRRDISAISRAMRLAAPMMSLPCKKPSFNIPLVSANQPKPNRQTQADSPCWTTCGPRRAAAGRPPSWARWPSLRPAAPGTPRPSPLAVEVWVEAPHPPAGAVWEERRCRWSEGEAVGV